MNKYTGFKRATNEFYPIFDGDDIGWQEADTIFIGTDGENHTGATPSEEDVALFKEWYSTNNPHTARRYTISHAATCYPDYFGGHQYSFCIYADGNTTYQDLKDGMLDWQNTDHLTYSLFKTDYEWGLYQDAVELLFQDAEQEGTMQDIFDPRLDIPVTEEEQEEYSCYAWFIIEPELEEMEEDESVVCDTTGEDHAI